MKQNKFRAWDKENEEMLSDVSLENDTWDMMNEFFRNEDSLIFMQYIGMKDINSKEIYEGDYLSVVDLNNNNGFHGKVIFSSGGFCLETHKNNNKYHVPFTSFEDTKLNCIIKVLGNPYENPELVVTNK